MIKDSYDGDDNWYFDRNCQQRCIKYPCCFHWEAHMKKPVCTILRLDPFLIPAYVTFVNWCSFWTKNTTQTFTWDFKFVHMYVCNLIGEFYDELNLSFNFLNDVKPFKHTLVSYTWKTIKGLQFIYWHGEKLCWSNEHERERFQRILSMTHKIFCSVPT